jgi:hypothetical protein
VPLRSAEDPCDSHHRAGEGQQDEGLRRGLHGARQPGRLPHRHARVEAWQVTASLYYPP